MDIWKYPYLRLYTFRSHIGRLRRYLNKLIENIAACFYKSWPGADWLFQTLAEMEGRRS